jgi:hypothetical protein
MEGIGLVDGFAQAPPVAAPTRGGLIAAVRDQGIQPRDPRVQRWWRRLRRQGLLQQNPWARALLLRMWRQGLVARPRPRTAERLAALLQQSRQMGAGAMPGLAPPGVSVGITFPGGAPWMTGLIQAVRYGGFRPRDPRVRLLWRLMQRRGLLQRDPWLRRFLLYSWRRGLVPRSRALTAGRLMRHLAVRRPIPGAYRRPYGPAAYRPGFRRYPSVVRPRVYAPAYRRSYTTPYRRPTLYRAPVRAWRR